MGTLRGYMRTILDHRNTGSCHIQQGTRDAPPTAKGPTVAAAPVEGDDRHLILLRTIKAIRNGGTRVHMRDTLVSVQVGDTKQIASFMKVDDLFKGTEELFFIVVRTSTTMLSTAGRGLNRSLCSTVWVRGELIPRDSCGNTNMHIMLVNTGTSTNVEVQKEDLAELQEDCHSFMPGPSSSHYPYNVMQECVTLYSFVYIHEDMMKQINNFYYIMHSI